MYMKGGEGISEVACMLHFAAVVLLGGQHLPTPTCCASESVGYFTVFSKTCHLQLSSLKKPTQIPWCGCMIHYHRTKFQVSVMPSYFIGSAMAGRESLSPPYVWRHHTVQALQRKQFW